MKKSIVIIMCLLVAILFVNCYKEPTYKAIINCYYSTNGIDKGAPVPFCLIDIGEIDYADFATRDTIADANGQYKTTFLLEALLEVRAKIDSILLEPVFEIDDEGDTITTYNEITIPYSGKGKLKLEENQEIILDVLLIKEE